MAKNILIVEDSTTQAINLEYALTGKGYEVVHAENGVVAQMHLNKAIFDMVISDISMPEMDGFELCEYIRSNKKFEKYPVILLTSLDDKMHLLKGIACGADTFISKPFDISHLSETMESLFSGKSFQVKPDSLWEKLKGKADKNTLNFLLSAYETAVLKNKALEQSQEELRVINSSLEELVTKRTNELELAKEKAENSDRLKSIFLSNASHDIRTPINSIIGFTDLLKDDTLDLTDRHEYLDLVAKNGEILSSLINDIIDLSKIEAGKLHCDNVTNFNLNELLEDIEKTFLQYKYLRDNDDVLLMFNRSHLIDQFIIRTDALRLKQILNNLISNAIKFTKKGSVEFGYHLNEEQDIEFYVKDTGIGIPDKLQTNIFERFEQVKGTINYDLGSGLGLAISSKLAEALGGHIWLKSKVKQGSTFRFTIPFTPPEGMVYNHFPKVEKVSKQYDFKQAKILIAEDDLSNSNFLKAVLKKTNVRTVLVKNGRNAVNECLNDKEIALVLMDLNMPIMDGLEATRRIKEKHPDLPIIAQTAFVMSGDEEKCYEAGCDDYLSKPIRRKVLLSKMDQLLNKNTQKK